MSHTMYYRIVDTARTYGKPVRYFGYASWAKCADQVVEGEKYSFEITGENITRYGVKTEETSPGCLVKDHFEPVFGCLYLAHLLKDCEVKEAMAQ